MKARWTALLLLSLGGLATGLAFAQDKVRQGTSNLHLDAVDVSGAPTGEVVFFASFLDQLRMSITSHRWSEDLSFESGAAGTLTLLRRLHDAVPEAWLRSAIERGRAHLRAGCLARLDDDAPLELGLRCGLGGSVLAVLADHGPAEAVWTHAFGCHPEIHHA